MAIIKLSPGVTLYDKSFGGMRIVYKNTTKYLRKTTVKSYIPTRKKDINNYISKKTWELWKSLTAEQQNTYICYSNVNSCYSSGYHLFGHVNIINNYMDISDFNIIRYYKTPPPTPSSPTLDSFTLDEENKTFTITFTNNESYTLTFRLRFSVGTDPNDPLLDRYMIFGSFSSSISYYKFTLEDILSDNYYGCYLEGIDQDSGLISPPSNVKFIGT